MLYPVSAVSTLFAVLYPVSAVSTLFVVLYPVSAVSTLFVVSSVSCEHTVVLCCIQCQL